MKTIVAVCVVIAALMLSGCDSTSAVEPIFKSPQPDNVASLSSFPKRLQGQYIDSNRTSILTISDKMVIRAYEYNSAINIDSLPDDYIIQGDSLVDTVSGTKEPMVLKGDTVTQHVAWRDTVFNMSPGYVLKKFKGHYFLSIRYEDTAWGVLKLSLHRGKLTVGAISPEDDIQQLREITETTADTTSFSFSLTKRQFRKFVKQDGFDYEEKFTRIKEIRK